jgi:hypothetical protein
MMLTSVILACACSAVLAGASVLWCSLFSNPAQFQKRCQRIESAFADLTRNYDALEAKWLQYKTEMAGLEEAIDGVLQSVERKRRQTAGAVSRMGNGGQPTVPQTRQEIVDAARAATYGPR